MLTLDYSELKEQAYKLKYMAQIKAHMLTLDVSLRTSRTKITAQVSLLTLNENAALCTDNKMVHQNINACLSIFM